MGNPLKMTSMHIETLTDDGIALIYLRKWLCLISWFFNALVEQKNQVIQAVTFLGWWKRDPFKGLSDLQLGDEKGTAWITRKFWNETTKLLSFFCLRDFFHVFL